MNKTNWFIYSNDFSPQVKILNFNLLYSFLFTTWKELERNEYIETDNMLDNKQRSNIQQALEFYTKRFILEELFI